MIIAVTGGSGFIGTALCNKLVSEGYDVRILDLVAPSLSSSKVSFLKTDLTNIQEVENSLEGVDVVYHLAGVVLKGMKQNPFLGNNLNVIGTLNILQTCVNLGIDKVLFASTFYVYDCVNKLDEVDEKTPLDIFSSDFFGASKIMSESLVIKYSEKYNLSYSIFRFGSVYGPGNSSNSVRNFISGAIQKKETVIWGTGNRSNQFTNVNDIADACVSVLEKEIWNQTFNLVSPEFTTTKELAEMVEDRYGGIFSFDPDKPEGHSFVKMSSKKARDMLNWNPRPLAECIDEVHSFLEESL